MLELARSADFSTHDKLLEMLELLALPRLAADGFPDGHRSSRTLTSSFHCLHQGQSPKTFRTRSIPDIHILLSNARTLDFLFPRDSVENRIYRCRQGQREVLL